MHIVKLEISNSRNDDVTYKWGFFKNEDFKNNWIAMHKKEQNIWNFQTAGALSTRHYHFHEYTLAEIMALDISELAGMQLMDLITLINYK